MDVREKLTHILTSDPEMLKNLNVSPIKLYHLVDKLIANGVTVQELDGCEYCKEDNEGYRKMIGSFSITNPFHGSVWNIETCHCKPRQIYFCPMCGRRLPQPPKGE